MKMLQVNYGSKSLVKVALNTPVIVLKEFVCDALSCNSSDVYFIQNGKILHDDGIIHSGRVHIVPRLIGGKGGFGSMLRAIGAQIEKTTNREACRDLSGRRLRDINEEKRLKTFINQQVEREKEAQERKRKKLERMCEMPSHEFVDEAYDKERSDLQEKVEDAIVKGLEVSDKQIGVKRKTTAQDVIEKKKPKLWVDAELDEYISDSDSESDDGETNQESVSISNSNSVECQASTSGCSS